MLRPARQALGWGLSSLLGLYRDYEPSSDLPPRLVQYELVEHDRLPEELAMRLAHVRQLSAPVEDGEDLPPPPPSAGAGMPAALRELIELGCQQVVEVGLQSGSWLVDRYVPD